jgi:long-chain acyl-CoA synthetase
LSLKDAHTARYREDAGMTITATQPSSKLPTHEQPELSQTIVAAFQASAARVPDRVALRTVGSRVSLTWAQYAQAVERAAGALAGLGVRHSDRVALLSCNSPQLAICEVAALHLGAATVVLYVASPASTIEHVLKDSDPQVLIVERDLLGRLDGVRHGVPHVIVLDGESPLEHLPTPADFSFQQAWQAVRPEDLLAICYTSGTTGPPKGVEWEHGPLMSSLDRFDLVHPEPDGCRDICFAPFAHTGERAVGHWRSLMRGSTRTICAAPTELPAALLDTRPTFLWGSPRVWQTLKIALESTLSQHERDVLDRSTKRLHPRAGDQAPPSLSKEDQNTLVELRARIGLDQLNRALTAAAPCPLGVQVHYHALGVPFAEFYGMSELGVPASGVLGGSDLGTVGRPTPGYEVTLDHDGEVLVRVDSRARGYRNRPVETAETFGCDGFIRTGDIGALDEQGRLRIIDRKKEILIDEHGHNTAPAPIESALKSTCPLIGHVCLVGEGRPYLAALILLEPLELASDPNAAAKAADAIERLNAASDPRERIQRHTILTAPWLPGEELTETLKLRRKRIAQKHADTIEAMYQSPSPMFGETRGGPGWSR